MEKLSHVSRREKRESMTKALGEYVSPLIADMYQTALNLFPARTLEEMRVVIKEDSGDFRGGEGEQDGEKVPMIVIGMQETLASPNLIARMSSRLGIPREFLENERTGRRVVGLVAFCHELGHIIQLDDRAMRAFGEIDNTIVPLPMDYTSEQYQAYVQSDREANADYIAACILAASQLGEAVVYRPPIEDAAQWRQWVAANPVILD